MNLAKRDLAAGEDGGLPDLTVRLSKFYAKYPEVKYMSLLGPLQHNKQGGISFGHPASYYVNKTQALMKKGYTETKARGIVE